MEKSLMEREKIILDFSDKCYVFSEEIKPQVKPFVVYEEINFTEIFNNNNPVNVEIGIGNGEFITHYAELNSDENYLGFEVVKKVIRKAISRVERKGLENVRLIHFDAKFFVNLFPNNSVRRFYINFPDPWPKKKHHKRRLLKPEFLNLMSEKLVDDGELFIATDHVGYKEEIVTNLITSGKFKSVFDSWYINELRDYYPTKYYRKFASKTGVYFFHLKNEK
ncbi:tRNA (guanosine(46)-N7)-methyltransferase TrmB [Deferribacter autotrophicus]|uniref:tRNA (guanine-N(7)-)-methyltransferase n=1 Tax=Deferribacter autotrophicus TaxID=500465 RepID=A0A5A8F6N2_9BACT|nr:tRNA (guanosine(46)-N7)-methyltransferase TrmB [Deferribacter autotrophicus]KAA0259490.1 tRNA (guanosine(46)-N7)-methyltransferase TrmB [Deferribacter autotrophicus]